MRRLAAALVVLGLAVVMGRADDTPAPKKSSVYDAPAPKGSPMFDALNEEFNVAQTKQAKVLADAQKAVSDAKTTAAKQEAQYAARFLAFAEKYPQDPMAFAAVYQAFKFSPRPATKDNTLGKTLVYFENNCVTKPQIRQIVRLLEANKLPASEVLLRDVLARNLDHRIQGHACKALLEISTKPGEKESLTKLLKTRYVDLFPDLSVGKPVPEIAVKDVNDKNVWLSDFKGKVIVIDIWATWCPHCRAMFPQEKQMVERLKGKPFVLVGINMDEKKETLTEFLAKDKLPWPQWWVGASSNLAEDWHIEYFPTVFVIDSRGVIRHEGVIGADLDKAVNELLKETEKKK